jgi:type II restriction enzyme
MAETVVSGSPIDGGRREELIELFKDAKLRLVFVTAFPDRGEVFRKFLEIVAWGTEVWCSSDPSHLIHFNGERFL